MQGVTRRVLNWNWIGNLLMKWKCDLTQNSLTVGMQVTQSQTYEIYSFKCFTIQSLDWGNQLRYKNKRKTRPMDDMKSQCKNEQMLANFVYNLETYLERMWSKLNGC